MVVLLFKLALTFIILFLFTGFVSTAMYNASDGTKMREKIAPFLDSLSGYLFMTATVFGALWTILLIWTASFGS